jgi:hypothetical protein
MKRIAGIESVALMTCALLLSACSPGDAPVAGKPPAQAAQPRPLDPPQVGEEDDLPTNTSKRRLPAEVLPVAGAPHFGIALDSLDDEGRAIVEDAWRDYSAILAGGEPDCAVDFALSDGGTMGYFCDGYDIVRVQTLVKHEGVDGFEYGAMLDFLNGRKLESLRFLSEEDMRRLEASAGKR